MKYPFIVLTLLLFHGGFAQTDRSGNPVFNSIPMGEDSLEGCRLLANYYTLRDNIDNKTSSVYIADSPTIKDIAKAATHLPADFFVVVKNGAVISMILVRYYPDKQLLVVTPGAARPKIFDSHLKGEIAENRANELVKARYDPECGIRDCTLSFNGKHYTITSNEAMRQAVIDLIRNEHLGGDAASGMKLLSKDELHAKILAETKEGGELDYFTPIKGKEMEGFQWRPGLIATRIEYALYSWGKANFDLGVASVDEAYSIFAEFRGRPLNMRETGMIKYGFDRKFEK